jgi:SAM-dependent methyltransferase
MCIRDRFSTQQLIKKSIDKEKIKTYYKESNLGYKYLHSEEGAVHMAINYNGVYDDSGLYTQVNEISIILAEKDFKSVLELGCGKGFNSIFLAKLFPQIKFYGIDITHEHLLIAEREGKSIDNLEFSYGDFHDIEYKNESFDLIFELESICHALDHEKVLKSIYSKLKDGGIFILYDGFRMNHFLNLPDDLIRAAILTEKSMAVNTSLEIDQWLQIAKEIGFKVSICDNISTAIMPNLGRLQRLARAYFKYPFIAKFILVFLSREMLINSIAGLLMPFVIHNNAQGYYKIVLHK